MKITEVVITAVPAAESVRVTQCEPGQGTIVPSNPDKELLGLFILFHTLVIREGVPFEKVYEAFLAIDEYREVMSINAVGTDGEPV